MFTTTPGVPTGQGAAVTAVHSDRAVLHAQVNPNGADTNVHFEYVDDATFQQSGWANANGDLSRNRPRDGQAIPERQHAR